MRYTIPVLLALLAVFIVFFSCENHGDPFSGSNTTPEIQQFAFDDDSLKFTTANPFTITLQYRDAENQPLVATFKFLSGSGDIIESQFSGVSRTDNTITFDVPGQFNDKIDFIPDTTGKVEIELELSDKVKLSTRSAKTFFFKNLAPVASFTYRWLTTVSPYQIELDPSDSYDPDGAQGGGIELYVWRFGDGTAVTAISSDTTVKHTYMNAGSYTVRLKVADNDGGLDSTEQIVYTDNQPPVASLQVNPVNGAAPLLINYTATNSQDPDGQIVAYRIDFDDGSSTLDSAGTHLYTVDKDYRVKLRVTDNLGQTDTTSVLVRVTTPPVAVLSVSPTQGPFPLQCLFNGTSSYDPQDPQGLYLLDFEIFINNQLIYSNIDSVVHTFSAPAVDPYQVRLEVTSQRNGLTAQATRAVTVTNLNPVANFSWTPNIPGHQQLVTYTSTSSDPNPTDSISYYRWTFPFGDVIQGADKRVVTKIFDAGVDTYKVKLEVWDKYRGTPFEGYDFITKIIPKNTPLEK